MKLKRALLLATQSPGCFSNFKKNKNYFKSNASDTETNWFKTYDTNKNNIEPTGLEM